MKSMSIIFVKVCDLQDHAGGVHLLSGGIDLWWGRGVITGSVTRHVAWPARLNNPVRLTRDYHVTSFAASLETTMSTNSPSSFETDEWADEEVKRALADMNEEDVMRQEEDVVLENFADESCPTLVQASSLASLYKKMAEARSVFLQETSQFMIDTREEVRTSELCATTWQLLHRFTNLGL